MDHQTHVAAFIQRGQDVSGSERANYQLFIADLCDLLGVPTPEPAHEHTRDNAYVFERRVTFAHGDGSQSNGYIDCYKRGAFVLEAKKVKAGVHTKGFDDALLRARSLAGRGLRPRTARRRRPPAVRRRHRCGPCDRAVRRIHPQRRHLHTVPRCAQPPHPPR